jgi:PAB-dependent poly(A)-specific ribonuclease subunit 3
MVHFITTCVEGNSKIEELCRGLGERLSMEVGQQLGHADFLMHECAKELHNGRLMKLLIKLNFAYAATADAATDPVDAFAIRSLFQHLFSQVDDKAQPKYDWGHVFYSLNKLDTGSEDVVQLISEGDLTLLVISWRDLRTLLERVVAPMTAKPVDA